MLIRKLKLTKYSSVHHLSIENGITLCGREFNQDDIYSVIDERVCSRCQDSLDKLKEEDNGESKRKESARAINWKGKLATWEN
jgi:hypothetical protein